MTVRLIDLAQEAISAVRSDCHDLSTRQKQRAADEAVEALFAALKGIDVRAAVVAASPSDTSQGVSEAAIRTVIHQLRTYNPAADAYKGKYIHRVWADELETALRSEPGEKS